MEHVVWVLICLAPATVTVWLTCPPGCQVCLSSLLRPWALHPGVGRVGRSGNLPLAVDDAAGGVTGTFLGGTDAPPRVAPQVVPNLRVGGCWGMLSRAVCVGGSWVKWARPEWPGMGLSLTVEDAEGPAVAFGVSLEHLGEGGHRSPVCRCDGSWWWQVGRGV
jgi:hypothetical protein